MKKVILSIFVLSVSFFTMAQIDRSKAPVPGPAPKINIPTPEVFELDNGIKVILSSDHRLPRVSFNLVMGSEPRLEGDKAGLSDLAGELMLSGTSTREKDQLDAEKDFIGATLTASSNSLFLSCLTKHTDKGMDLMTDVLYNANFPESELERVAKQFESSLISIKSDANSMASNATAKVIFSDEHPRGEVMTLETLKNITRDDLLDYYKSTFIPAGSYLVIVGDINLEDAKKIANDRFGAWEGGVPFEKEYEKGVFPDKNKVYFVERKGAVQSVISIAFPINMEPGDEDQIKLSVLNKLFGGGGFGTRLMQNLREDKAWTYGAYSRLDVGRTGSKISASGSFASEVSDSAIHEFLYEFNRITEDLVSDEELELNKASMAGSFARSLESPQTIARFALNTYRNNLPQDYYQTYLQKLSAVSKEDVLAVAKKYITPQNLNIIVVGNTDAVDKIKQFSANGEVIQLNEFGDLYEEKTFGEADITKSEVIENYLMAVTQTKSMDDANAKIGKVNTMQQTIGMKPQGMPVEFTMEMMFSYPYSNYTSVEFQGMTVQKEVFNGEKGMSQTMNQSGGQDTELLKDDEVEAKKKTSGLFPELALVCDGIEYSLLGMDTKNEEKCYVIEYTVNETTTMAYYRASDFMKRYIVTSTMTDEGAQESNATFSDFKAVNGILFPHSRVQMIGGTGVEATIKEIKINEKLDKDAFKM